MLTREKLLDKFKEINMPANIEEIRRVEQDLNWSFTDDYIIFLLLSSGLTTEGMLVLYELDALVERNRTYEVQFYLPEYLMIGDDSGGEGILIKKEVEVIYEIDMGGMDYESMSESAPSLEILLLSYGGKTLLERS